VRRHYKKTSGFKTWNQYNHAEDYLIYPENIGENLSIDDLKYVEDLGLITKKNKQYVISNAIYREIIPDDYWLDGSN
jgi:hypothetical protein